MIIQSRPLWQFFAAAMLLAPVADFAQTGASCDSRVHLGTCTASLRTSNSSITLTADANCALVQWHAGINSFADVIIDGSVTREVALSAASLQNSAVDSCTILKDVR
jgi:hypothetical protein